MVHRLTPKEHPPESPTEKEEEHSRRDWPHRHCEPERSNISPRRDSELRFVV